MKKIFSVCPLCSCKTATQVWEVSYSEQASHFLSPLVNRDKYEKLREHIQCLQKSSSVSLNKCSDCNFIYSYPNIAGDKKFYDLIFSDTNKYPQNRWEFIKSIEIIKNSKFKKPKILEIGSGDGAFIRKLVKKRITTKNSITAIEYSIFGKSKIKEFGIECLSIDIKDHNNKLPHEEYDFICLFQVLEHLDNIHKLIDRLKNLLSKNGELLIAVPNEKIIKFNELNGALLDMPPNHIGRWTKSSFKYLAEKNDLFMKKHKFEPFSFQKITLEFGHYRYLKNAQNNKSIENTIESKHLKRYYRVIKYLGIFINIIKSIPLVFKNYNTIYGDSQIVHLVKK